MSAARNRRVSRSQASHASNPRARRKAREGERAMERGRRTAIPAVLADAAVRLAGHAMTFGRIDRTACRHPDGRPESDSDHTVMLAWLAPALAEATERHLDAGLVAQFALVHDAVEVFAGDTPTLRIDADGRAAKKAREEAAQRRWRGEFGRDLPWLPWMIGRYEAQAEPEARFTRAVDKICPKLVHLLSGGADLADYGVTVTELEGILARQRAEVTAYAGEFTGLLALHDDLAVRTVAALRCHEAREAGAA